MDNTNTRGSDISVRTAQNVTIIKFIMIGNPAVGKTSLMTRYFDEGFDETHLATIGVNGKVKKFDDLLGKKVKL
jgi:GTPase SAR1 family protein